MRYGSPRRRYYKFINFPRVAVFLAQTRIELKPEEAYTLDIAAARIAIRELKSRAFALEKLIDELGQQDKVEVRNPNTGKIILQRRRRIVCSQIAAALFKSYPEGNIFMSWTKWIAKTRKKKIFLKY